MYDHRLQEASEYKDQHAVLGAYYKRIYLEDQEPTFDLLSIMWSDQTIRVDPDTLDNWLRKQFALEVKVRLNGSDIDGLDTYVMSQGYEIVVERNPNIHYVDGIDWGYYFTSLRPYDGGYVKFGYGATKVEALAHAFIK